MNRDVLANHIARANLDSASRLRFETQILRPTADDRAVTDHVARTNSHRTVNYRVGRHDDRALFRCCARHGPAGTLMARSPARLSLIPPSTIRHQGLIVVCLSGRGDKDMDTAASYFGFTS